ncbi:hypothetical protein CONPUDRAFT_100293 [Coniophora puteana RWD-64-598 SS2]|uniref:PIN domain-like protein n=1 Tax=Coniophora puteana (strain RWD-64-598) TaxID=741705 RepID=A0A5M3N091_CONPW|nr:uncharacterized protein CONPUDRAFT_100293 [Coniophora puteana RWD-64-598 SS2]EIW84325.1 hypothetical protein CONPUDRAFT_100293 [Coniophora puteana RWD-64-598 SS2]
MGVKSLWSLVEPVGRPVPLETVEGKAMAIDSSIWIYQFQATMRDRDGRGLVNAHVLGFLRRICKLLFYGVRPVFVFDGGAPAMKRGTIMERKRKKSGAAASHAKVAERLLAAHMRREALAHARPPPAKGKSKVPTEPARLDETAVYLEDLEGDGPPRTPAKPPPPKDDAASPPSSKKNRFHDYDPYRLPDVDLSARIADKARAGGGAPDPRLATEDELRAFIEEMRPEDIDVASPAFRELPTEVQYEIVGDLRLRSRQTSHARLQAMLRGAPTPLDFSRAQIMGLKQRNALTQQLLETTDSIGNAHVTIPVRIASERNREYVLVKNEGAEGGWVLGIRDEGSSSAKPIEIDQDEKVAVGGDEDEDEDMELEEVPIPGSAAMHPNLREYQQTMALSAIGKRAPTQPVKPVQRKNRQRFLFDLDDDELPAYHPQTQAHNVEDAEEDDADLAMAIQASLDARHPSHAQGPSPCSASAPGASVFGTASSLLTGSTAPADTPKPSSPSKRVVHELSDEEDLYATPSRLQTALSIGGAAPFRSTSGEHQGLGRPVSQSPLAGGKPVSRPPPAPTPRRSQHDVVVSHSPPSKSTDGISANSFTQFTVPAPVQVNSDSGNDDMEEVFPQLPHPSNKPETKPLSQSQIQGHHDGQARENNLPLQNSAPTISGPMQPSTLSQASDSEGYMEEVDPSAYVAPCPEPIAVDEQPPATIVAGPASHGVIRHADDGASESENGISGPAVAAARGIDVADGAGAVDILAPSTSNDSIEHGAVAADDDDDDVDNDVDVDAPSSRRVRDRGLGGSGVSGSSSFVSASASASAPARTRAQDAVTPLERVADVAEEEESDSESLVNWPQSPPASGRAELAQAQDGGHGAEEQHQEQQQLQQAASGAAAEAESWDAAQEMDAHAEEGEFARFISDMRGRDIDTVRREIDDEIRVLNQQKKAAMRDSDDITTQMISQIMLMLRLFGIPYITAPMEAEAQCAELVQLGLVEGVITDDSDVFLFGGLRVFKNMFNQSKTVECFLLSDLARELGLERDTLVRLAYLLGSDYVEGLPGVGPVVAMELLKEFPGADGLHKFRDWWGKVQSGRDREADSQSKFRKRFKKKFKDLYLPPEWPNPQVRDAYYHPTVDSSREPFKWGMPDLDALREFLREELSWGQKKVDDLLLPIIQKMSRRKQSTTSNKQGNLNVFLDVSSGTGSYAPRKRQAYGSKRLQQVVSDFRKEQARKQGAAGGRPTNATPGPAGSSRSGSAAAFELGGDGDDVVGGDDDESVGGDDAEKPPKKKRRKTAASASASASATSKGKGKEKEKKETAMTKAKAKPRPKPKPRQRKNAAPGVEDDAAGAAGTSLARRKTKGKGKASTVGMNPDAADPDAGSGKRRTNGPRSRPQDSDSEDELAGTGGSGRGTGVRDDNDDEFRVSGSGAGAIPSRPLEVQLRPRVARPKPRLVSGTKRKKRAGLYDSSSSDGAGADDAGSVNSEEEAENSDS